MIDRQHDQIVIECDGCDNVHESGTLEWSDAWGEAKRLGWKSRKIGKDWVRLCERCKP